MEVKAAGTAQHDQYGSTQVRFYDFTHNHDHDIPFYRTWLREISTSVLELAAGSGRITIPLARAGQVMIGLDISAAMLSLAQKRVSQEDASVAERITWIQADMSQFKLQQSVGAVIVGANSFLLLRSLTRQSICLQHVHHHLISRGLLIIDSFNPATFLQDFAFDGRPMHLYTRHNPSTGLMTSHLLAAHHDPALQVIVSDNILEEYDHDGTVRRFAYTETLRYLHRYEMQLLLEKCGFELIGVYGGYDRRPFDSTSKKMIFVARRK